MAEEAAASRPRHMGTRHLPHGLEARTPGRQLHRFRRFASATWFDDDVVVSQPLSLEASTRTSQRSACRLARDRIRAAFAGRHVLKDELPMSYVIGNIVGRLLASYLLVLAANSCWLASGAGMRFGARTRCGAGCRYSSSSRSELPDMSSDHSRPCRSCLR